ncbi:MAG: hypothetical protein NT130_04375 [Candidatus Micrarchaeota archaeon]|nr:hypothetical protein [Candidatus Micrarchaeota archaeon]
MSGNVSVKKKDEELGRRLNELIEDCLVSSTMGGPKWLVSKETRVAIIGDASKFYNKIEELGLTPKIRLMIAMQLSLDNNKCPVNLSGRHDGHRMRLNDIRRARDITEVGRVEKPAEYVDSLVSFLVNTDRLRKEKAGGVAEIAKETLARYEERKIPISNPMTLSAAAVLYACCKEGVPMSAFIIGNTTGLGGQSIWEASDRLIEIARPDELFEFKAKKGPKG